MRSRSFTAIFVLLVLAIAVAGISVHAQQEPQHRPVMPGQAAPAGSTIKTQTRLITVDVVVTDSHGNPVPGLKQEDFQISEEHAGQQQIAKFQFVDTSAIAATEALPAAPSGPGVFSNLQVARSKVPPTAILMDALNTETFQQMRVRRDMLLFLQKLPPDTPVAVFLLGHELHLVQNFTTNPAMLKAAVDQAHRPASIELNPQDDANSASMQMQNNIPNMPQSVILALENFEKEEYQEQMDQRVSETADAMKSIAKFLSGYPGRKNLIWFSESFPIWLQPSSDFGSDPFMGSTTYGDKVRAAADALTDARVAVYPVDARGLEGLTAYSASNDNISTPSHPGGDIQGAQNRADNLRIDSQATMDDIADETGGKTCKNTNDLAGCVQRALNESSSYYELAYYPQNVKSDGSFHKITVKTVQHGLKLSYRRGYFAVDTVALAKNASPENSLKEACGDPLPSTKISLTVEAVQPQQGPGKTGESRYLLTISPAALSLDPANGTRTMDVQMAICEFDPKGDSYQFFPRDLSRPVPDAVYQGWQAHGIRNIFDYAAKPENQRLRFAVLDVPSGAIGAVDVPAHPQEFGSLPAPAAPGPSTMTAATPAPAQPKPPTQIMTQINFKAGEGVSSALDWSTDKLWYHGNLGIDQGAPAFFKSVYGAKYHCDGGKLVPNDPSASAAAVPYLFTFHSPAGPGALVQLGGDAPAYSGNLPIDPSAKAFFDYFWKLCHCQQP
jgi:VWFA-related protein